MESKLLCEKMIDKFKSFFQKRKKENTFDSEYTKDVINDIISPLEDVRGVTINISDSIIQNDSKSFIVKYNLKLTTETDLEEFKNEILNCKSHIKSEDLIMSIELLAGSAEYYCRIFIYTHDCVSKYKTQFNSFQNTISIINFIIISNDTFSSIRNRYSIEIRTGGLNDTYVQITKGMRNGIEIPYKFINIKDNVLNFFDKLKESNIELSFVYENDSGGFSIEHPSYDDIKSGLYDKREVSILTISKIY